MIKDVVRVEHSVFVKEAQDDAGIDFGHEQADGVCGRNRPGQGAGIL
jgi:hypothetical protein